MNKERIDIRVEPELLEELDIIAQRKGFKSRSSIIREAIASYVLENHDGWNATGMRVSVPNRMAEKIQRHVMNGDAMDTEGAILQALDFWLRDLENYYLVRRDKLDRIAGENAESDRGMKELESRAREIGRP